MTIGYGKILLLVAISFILPRIPVIGKFFNIINTALHEFGHALAALLTNGTVEKIQLFKDTSGTTVTRSGNKLASVIVSLAGYPFAASVAWLSFYLIKNGVCLELIVGLTILFLIMLLFWIRNWYGVLWVFLFCAANSLLLIYGKEQQIEIVALFYAVMILTESVVSSLVLLVISFRDSNRAGDATNLARVTHIPALLWSLMFLTYALWITYRVVLMLFF